MKALLLLPALLILSESKSCEQQSANSGVPQCIQQLITDFQNKPVRNPPAEIYEYDYNGQKVFYVNAPCCDQYNTLYDSNCNVLCAPDGGFTGKGDNKCADFNEKKTNEKLIWKDSRSN